MIIRGDGIAAYCCAHLLQKAGLRIDLEPGNRPRLPAILLGEQAVALIRDIFGQPDLFAHAAQVGKRVVAWGTDAASVSVDHSAVLVSEDALLRAIQPAPSTEGREFEWTILAAGTVPLDAYPNFTASAVPVTLKPHSDRESCWIESLEEGWLFLMPGWLLAVGASPEMLLARSRVVAAQIDERGLTRGTFLASARIASPLAAHGWLTCGSAAMAFDPICGDGTANAVREAILASAVVRAIARGGPEEDLLAHYHARMIAGFQRHLALCRQFYSTGGSGAMWRSQVEAIDWRIARCRDALSRYGEFRYQLRGLELEAVR